MQFLTGHVRAVFPRTTTYQFKSRVVLLEQHKKRDHNTVDNIKSSHAQPIYQIWFTASAAAEASLGHLGLYGKCHKVFTRLQNLCFPGF